MLGNTCSRSLPPFSLAYYVLRLRACSYPVRAGSQRPDGKGNLGRRSPETAPAWPSGPCATRRVFIGILVSVAFLGRSCPTSPTVHFVTVRHALGLANRALRPAARGDVGDLDGMRARRLPIASESSSEERPASRRTLSVFSGATKKKKKKKREKKNSNPRRSDRLLHSRSLPYVLFEDTARSAARPARPSVPRRGLAKSLSGGVRRPVPIPPGYRLHVDECLY